MPSFNKFSNKRQPVQNDNEFRGLVPGNEVVHIYDRTAKMVVQSFQPPLIMVRDTEGVHKAKLRPMLREELVLIEEKNNEPDEFPELSRQTW